MKNKETKPNQNKFLDLFCKTEAPERNKNKEWREFNALQGRTVDILVVAGMMWQHTFKEMYY